ncbi:unnamed protein product [Rodentolepis nana]|uniref:GRIP domain-containing protein n=1 Tax=Rodentolepis nana TaxID=102285 RepID=A0A0R3T0V3_RODNA|nr:unnamed protein product [Rodentolepis nana]
MSRKVPDPENSKLSNSESFLDESLSSDRSPLLPVQNILTSPDVGTKKLLSDIRLLSMKVNQLQNYNDDIENEKRELLLIISENESRISLLEEKCRIKDRELNENRDFCSELELIRPEYERTKCELDRVTNALRQAQELAQTAELLEKENDIKVLESNVEELKAEVGYKPMYEQVREALATAEQTLADLLDEKERARELSEAEALDLNGKSHSTPWSKISRAKCTCTCHHSPATPSHQLSDMAMRRFSTVSNFDTGNITPARSNGRQSLGDPSVLDVSLWRDFRTGPNPQDISGECLGEVMAQDAKIQELQVQLDEARFEIDRLNGEIFALTSQNSDLAINHKAALEELELRLKNLESVKQALESELDIKSVVLNEANDRIDTLLSENTLISDDLDQIKEKFEQVQGELYSTKVQLNETCIEVDRLNEEISNLNAQKSDLTNEHKVSLDSLKLNVLNLESAKQSLEYELEQKCAFLNKADEEKASLLAKYETLFDKLEKFKEENETIFGSLELQLRGARSDAKQVTLLTNQSYVLANEHTVKFEEFASKVKSLELDKANLLFELDEKHAAVREANSHMEKLSIENKTLAENLSCVKLQIQEATGEKTILSEKLAHIAGKLTQLVEKVELSAVVNCEAVRELCDTQEDIHGFQDISNQLIDALAMKVLSLKEALTDSQDKLGSSEAHRLELLERIDFFQNNGLEVETRKKELVQQLTISTTTIDDLAAKNQKLSIELEDKVKLIEYLKSERADMINERTASFETENSLKAELLQAQKDITQLTNELSEARCSAMLIDELESSLRAHDSDVSALNQLIQDHKATISILRSEKTCLESSIEALKAELESKTNILDTITKERDEVREDLAKHLREFYEEKDCLLSRLRDLDSHLESQNKENTKLSERFTLVEQELNDCLKELSLKEGEVTTLKAAFANHIIDKTNLQVALNEKNSLADSLQEEIVSLNLKVTNLEKEASRHVQELVLLETEKSSISEKLEIQTTELMNKETEMISLRDQLSLLTEDHERLVNQNAVLESDRAKLEAELASGRQQYMDSRVKSLKRQLSVIRGEHMETEQSLAEAKKNASLAEMHRQVAENETARLNKLVNILQKRLDIISEERMACEERAASEAVLCRQLEGTLSEKEAVIEGLRHQLNQIDIQRKSAQEKEASTLREYLKSRAAQDEAERRLAMLEFRSTLNTTGQRRSYCSLDQLANQNTSLAGEFIHPPLVRRRHSAGKVDATMKSPPILVDLDKSMQGKSNLFEKVGKNTTQSPLLEERFPVPIEDLKFLTPMPANFREISSDGAARMNEVTIHDVTFVSCLEEPICTTPLPIPPRSPILHFIEDADVTLCTPMTAQQTDPLSGMQSQVGPVMPQECAKSSINVADVTEVPVQVADCQSAIPCTSAASSTTAATNSLTAVSDLENWPPYSSCTAPLSPKARRADVFFAVPPSFEFHYRRLKRFMITPAAEEDLDMSDNLEEKPLPNANIGNALHSTRGETSNLQPVAVTEKKADRVTPASVRSGTHSHVAGGDSLFVEETGRNEINSRIHLFKSRTIQSKTRPVSLTEQSDDNSSLSTSISRPAKLARFRSVQNLSNDDPSRSHALNKKSSRGGPPVSFNRFKHRFGIHGNKSKTNDTSITTTTGSVSGVRDSSENISAKEDSSKQKKHAKASRILSRFDKLF